MSVHVSSWAWKQSIGDDGAKLVLLKLADSANDDGVSWPSRETLLSETGAGHEDTIKRRLRKLRELGLVISVPWNDSNGRQTSSMHVLPHRGIPSAEKLAELVEKANRKGSLGVSLDALRAADAVGSFLSSGGASVHPLNFGSGGASTHPSGGAPAHPSIEEPSFEPSEEELRSSLPADAGESASTRLELMRAFGAERGINLAGLTSRERRQWELAADDLVSVGATPADVTARCAAYRSIWPEMRLTPLAIVGHWSLLSAEVVAAKPSGFDAWLEEAPARFDLETAHEIVADLPALSDQERADRHFAVDDRYARLDTGCEEAA
jgi:hypothetical protein